VTQEQIDKIWEKLEPTTVIDGADLFEKVHDTVIDQLKTFFNVEVYSYPSFDQPIEITESMIAPCIILIGPALKEQQSPIFDQTFDVGIDEGGRVETEKWHHIDVFDFFYSIQYDAENVYQLMSAMSTYIAFFKEKTYINIYGQPYQTKREELLSPDNVRNYTDVATGRGSFCIERIPLANSEYVFRSKRVQNIKINGEVKHGINQ